MAILANEFPKKPPLLNKIPKNIENVRMKRNVPRIVTQTGFFILLRIETAAIKKKAGTKYLALPKVQSQALTKNEKVRFAHSPTLDFLFASKISDATRSYNGSSWSTTTNVTVLGRRLARKKKLPIVDFFKIELIEYFRSSRSL